MDYDRIRQQYLLEKKSQRQIAKELGISHNTVAKYCKGGAYPGLRASYKRARSVVTQNAKVAVKSRAGKQAIPQEAYAAHYCFQMDFCNVRSGNKKGFGENLVGTIRCNALSTAPQVRAKGSCSFLRSKWLSHSRPCGTFTYTLEIF